jgi:hypothetical protein
MNNRLLGTGLVVVGVALIILGLVLRGGSTEADVEAAPTTVASMTAPPPSTTVTTVSTPETTTTVAPTTTTTTMPPTTTTVPPPSIEAFIEEYAAATESGDEGFLFERLLPGVVDVLGADTCRGFVANEITLISDYRLTGMVSGPFSRSLNVGATQISVDDYYEAPVSFTFQGQSFDATATFVAVDGLIYWIGECR